MRVPTSWEGVVDEKRRNREEKLKLGFNEGLTQKGAATGDAIEGIDSNDLDNTSQYLATLRCGRVTCQSTIEAFINR